MWKSVLGCRSQFQSTFKIPFKGLSCPLLDAEISCKQQNRTTFVLRRKWPPGLSKKNQKPKKLSARHFVYDLVEDTNTKKQEDLAVILTSYVEGIGARGDQVSLKPHFVYNKLLLPGLAVYATPENIEKYANIEAINNEDEEKHSSPYAQITANILSTLVLAVVMNKDVPWNVEPWHIRASFRKAGVHVPEETITMPDQPITGPDMNLEAKQFYVTVTINNLETVRVPCRIHHWSTKLSDRLPFVDFHWKQEAELLFPESVPPPPSLKNTVDSSAAVP